MNFLEQYEGTIRLGVFVGVFVIMALVEAAVPRKDRVQGRGHRWLTNGGLAVVGMLVLRFALPILAVGMAQLATAKGWGLFSYVDWPGWLAVMLSVVVLDLLIFGQHVATHKFSLLWAVHKVHHTDRDIDVTTGIRFHPIEILLSMGYKLMCIMLLGLPALGVFIYEVVLNGFALFNHANLRLPRSFDRILRFLVVTPDMHRVHHSVLQSETDSNYGNFLSVWDRVFGTYVEQPQAGHDGMTIGLAEHQSDKTASLLHSMVLPVLPRPTRSASETQE